MEIVKAEAPRVATDLSAAFHLSCEGESSENVPGESTARWRMPVDGPWMGNVIFLASTERKHPVVLDFPKIDRTILDISPPSGFEAAPPPAAVHIEERWGRYTLEVKRAGAGFHVEREFMFGPILVKQPEYLALREFLQRIRKADQMDVEFVRAGGGS